MAVAEGALPAEGTVWDAAETLDARGNPLSGQVGRHLTAAIEEHTGFPARLTVLGYVQRGGVPTAADRLLATRFGVAAVDAVVAGEHGKFTALRGEEIQLRDFSVMAGKSKFVPEELLQTAWGL